MTNTKVSVVQKARYGVLFLPVAWLLFSIWIMINEATPRYEYHGVQEIETPASPSQIFTVSLYGLWTLWIFVKMLQKIKKHDVVSAELQSGLAFLLGMTLMAIDRYFPSWRFLSYIGMAMVDVAAIIMIVTLVQGKPFGIVKLYHKDVQIHKSV